MTDPTEGSRPRDERYVNDMLAHIADADEILAAGEAEYRLASSMLRFRAAKSIIIDLSSAADRVSEDFKAANPDVPWSSIHQMRSLLAHHYEGIQRKVVWDTLKYDLPRVRDLLRQALDLAE